MTHFTVDMHNRQRKRKRKVKVNEKLHIQDSQRARCPAQRLAYLSEKDATTQFFSVVG